MTQPLPLTVFFENVFDAEDAIISDELNRANFIDDIRLSKTARYCYGNEDTDDLVAKLKDSVNTTAFKGEHCEPKTFPMGCRRGLYRFFAVSLYWSRAGQGRRQD